VQAIARLQAWYAAQCDGNWEHSYGVAIDTLDNPGWLVKIDLTDTDLEEKSFALASRGDSKHDSDWLHCKVENHQFIGAGGASNLPEILEVFLTWAGQ
jgi:Immunity protein 53